MKGEREYAYAKVNLCLFLGGTRADGRHELVTLLESVELADELVVSSSPLGHDEVICPGVSGRNLVAGALAALRAERWGAPPVSVEIHKRIPITAGMGGGSADAAALLRCAPRLGPVSPEVLGEIAAGLGSDVPSQLDPGLALGTGAGEVVAAAPELAEHAVLVLPQPFELSTADVYREADRLGLGRTAAELAALRTDLESSLSFELAPKLGARLLVNDLEPASLSLRPEIAPALEAALEAGAEGSIVCGSGPTVIGLFWGTGSLERAGVAATQLRDRFPGATAVRPLARVRASAARRGHDVDGEP